MGESGAQAAGSRHAAAGRDILRPDEREYTALLSYLETALDAHAANIPTRAGPRPSTG